MQAKKDQIPILKGKAGTAQDHLEAAVSNIPLLCYESDQWVVHLSCIGSNDCLPSRDGEQYYGVEHIVLCHVFLL